MYRVFILTVTLLARVRMLLGNPVRTRKAVFGYPIASVHQNCSEFTQCPDESVRLLSF